MMNTMDEISERYARNEILQKKARENGSHYKVFDWDKAARIIKERNPEKAAAGLSEDWFWTGAVIWNDGKISDEWKPYLKSYWATPVIVLESAFDREEIECWIPAEETEWDENTHWPESARKIIEDTAKVRTNFERITESPETLAEFISEAEWFAERCAEQLLNCETCQCKWCGLAGKLNLIDWLKREELE